MMAPCMTKAGQTPMEPTVIMPPIFARPLRWSDVHFFTAPFIGVDVGAVHDGSKRCRTGGHLPNQANEIAQFKKSLEEAKRYDEDDF